jgi:hypothetical protein
MIKTRRLSEPAVRRVSSGVSDRSHDVQAYPKGAWQGRFLLVRFSCACKKMNELTNPAKSKNKFGFFT